MSYIKIDKDSRMLIENNNYILEYRVKAGKAPGGADPKEEYKWQVDGYFPTLDVLLKDWVANAPYRSKESLKSLQDVVDCIHEAEAHMDKLLARQ